MFSRRWTRVGGFRSIGSIGFHLAQVPRASGRRWDKWASARLGHLMSTERFHTGRSGLGLRSRRVGANALVPSHRHKSCASRFVPSTRISCDSRAC